MRLSHMQNVFVLVFAGAQVKKLEDAKDLHVVALLDPWYYFDFGEIKVESEMN